MYPGRWHPPARVHGSSPKRNDSAAVFVLLFGFCSNPARLFHAYLQHSWYGYARWQLFRIAHWAILLRYANGIFSCFEMGWHCLFFVPVWPLRRSVSPQNALRSGTVVRYRGHRSRVVGWTAAELAIASRGPDGAYQELSFVDGQRAWEDRAGRAHNERDVCSSVQKQTTKLGLGSTRKT